MTARSSVRGELSTRIPAALKWKDGVGKYILRRAAQRQLPREVAFRPKIGFSVPIRHWMRREPFRARFEAVLFAPQSARFFDQPLLRHYWSAFLAETMSCSKSPMRLMSS